MLKTKTDFFWNLKINNALRRFKLHEINWKLISLWYCIIRKLINYKNILVDLKIIGSLNKFMFCKIRKRKIYVATKYCHVEGFITSMIRKIWLVWTSLVSLVVRSLYLKWILGYLVRSPLGPWVQLLSKKRGFQWHQTCNDSRL